MTATVRSTGSRFAATLALGALLATGLAAAGSDRPVRAQDRHTSPEEVSWSAAAQASAELAAAQGVELAQQVLVELDRQGTTDFWVGFEDRADLSRASDIEDWGERGWYVYDRLVETAQASQARLRTQLRAAAVHYQPFWIANTVLVRDADQTVLDGVLTLPGIAQIRADEVIELPDPIADAGSGDAGVTAVEWGIANIRADQVWSELDVRGEDIVVGSIDTGVEYTHPALVSQYRGNAGERGFSHDYNWWDPSHVCPSEEPCDNHNHGTHTMGTMIGDDGAGNQIGVAPAAEWIAAKGCEETSCSHEALLSSGEFMLAPTNLDGGEPRPELRPQVVNNSWGGEGGRDFYDAVVAAWVAAGMFPVFSNGNNGPVCGSAGSPADGPDAYAAGAYDSSNTIAAFSSRGPGRNDEIRPNISAPGVQVRSSLRGGGYGLGSGTSMAAPHVAGTVALMWSASGLVGDVDATRSALDVTAVDAADLSCLGTAGNNNVYGQGRLDALGATIEVAVDSGVTGQVVDAAGGKPIAGARVRAFGDGPSSSKTTDADGHYRLRLLPGSYDLEFSRFGYEPLTVPDVVVHEGRTSVVNAELEPLPVGTLTGTVTLAGSGHGVPGVTIYAENTPLTTTGDDGAYTVDAPIGSYQVVARHPMFPASDPADVTVPEGGVVVADLVLACGEHCNVTGRWTARHDGPGSGDDVARALATSPDGSRIFATGYNRTGVIVTESNFSTVAYDAVTGDELWVSTFDTGNGSAWSIAASPDGAAVYVTGQASGGFVGHDFLTVAYDAATGDELWVARYDGPNSDHDQAFEVAVSPDSASVYVIGQSIAGDGGPLNNRDYATVAYDAATGEERWVSRHDGPGNGLDHPKALAVTGDRVFVTGTSYGEGTGGDIGTLAYDAATGDELWIARYNGPPGSGFDTANALRMSADGATIFVSGRSAIARGRHDYVTVAYDASTGGERWVAGYTGPASANDEVHAVGVSPDDTAVYVTGWSVGDGTGTDYATVAYDANDGDELWVARYDGQVTSWDSARALSLTNDRVFVTGLSDSAGTGGDYATIAYDAATGEEVWVARYNGPGNGFDGGYAARVSGDRVYVTGESLGAGTGADFATIAYDTESSNEAPVFVPSDLRVEPSVVPSGEPATVRVTITNVGAVGGEHDAVLLVDGAPEASTTVRLGSGESTQVSWEVTRHEPGTYQLRVGHLTAELRVRAAAPM